MEPFLLLSVRANCPFSLKTMLRMSALENFLLSGEVSKLHKLVVYRDIKTIILNVCICVCMLGIVVVMFPESVVVIQHTLSFG